MVFQVYLADYATTFFTYDATTCYITLGETDPRYNMPEPGAHCHMVPVSLTTMYSIWSELKCYRHNAFPANYCREFGDLSLQVTTSTDDEDTQPAVRRALYFDDFDGHDKHDEQLLLHLLEGLTVSDRVQRVAEVSSKRMHTLLGTVPLLRNLELCMKLCPRIQNNEGSAYIHSVIWHRYILQFGPATACGRAIPVVDKCYGTNCPAVLIELDDTVGEQTFIFCDQAIHRLAVHQPIDNLQLVSCCNQRGTYIYKGLAIGTKPNPRATYGSINLCNEAWFILRTMLAAAGLCKPIMMTLANLMPS